MNNRVRDFFDDNEKVEKKKKNPDGDDSTGWDYSNIGDFKKWIADNRGKVDCGKSAMKFVMAMGSEIAAIACVKWLHENGIERDKVDTMASQISDVCMEECDEEQKSIVRDCASIFANTGSVVRVMTTAFVCYSLIGARIAQELSSEAT